MGGYYAEAHVWLRTGGMCRDIPAGSAQPLPSAKEVARSPTPQMRSKSERLDSNTSEQQKCRGSSNHSFPIMDHVCVVANGRFLDPVLAVSRLCVALVPALDI